jgi:hypothetical protein
MEFVEGTGKRYGPIWGDSAQDCRGAGNVDRRVTSDRVIAFPGANPNRVLLRSKIRVCQKTDALALAMMHEVDASVTTAMQPSPILV